MLNTRELRIGNWVMTDKPEQAVDVLCDSLSTTTHKCMTMDSLSPIDLTPDVLRKCGFEDKNALKELLLSCPTGGVLTYQCYEGVHGVVYERDWEDDLIEPHDLFITSLHRLQNFYYAVTGEELNFQL